MGVCWGFIEDQYGSFGGLLASVDDSFGGLLGGSLRVGSVGGLLSGLLWGYCGSIGGRKLNINDTSLTIIYLNKGLFSTVKLVFLEQKCKFCIF